MYSLADNRGTHHHFDLISPVSQVKILQATGLPRHLSNFVFCQYHFWGQEEPVFVAPEMMPSTSLSTCRDPQCSVVFDSTKVRPCFNRHNVASFITTSAGLHILLYTFRSCLCQCQRRLLSFYPRGLWPLKCTATSRPTPAGTSHCGTSE